MGSPGRTTGPETSDLSYPQQWPLLHHIGPDCPRCCCSPCWSSSPCRPPPPPGPPTPAVCGAVSTARRCTASTSWAISVPRPASANMETSGRSVPTSPASNPSSTWPASWTTTTMMRWRCSRNTSRAGSVLQKEANLPGTKSRMSHEEHCEDKCHDMSWNQGRLCSFCDCLQLDIHEFFKMFLSLLSNILPVEFQQ